MSTIDRPPTRRQLDFVRAVEEFSARGYGASIAELASRLSVSTARAFRIGAECVERGLVVHEPRIPRSWRIAPTSSTSRRRSR